MELGLRDRIVYVGGASRGIGLGIARAFLDEGARVVLVARGAEALRAVAEELAAHHGADRVLALTGDLTDPIYPRTSLAQAATRWGGLDVVVANVGAGSDVAGWELPDEEFRRAFDQNFWAGQRVAQAAVQHLRGRDGVIIFTGSLAGFESIGAPASYEAAKAALTAYAKAMARLLGPLGIRVNVVAPGNVLFPGGRWAGRLKTEPERVRGMLEREVPLRRLGTPAEIAAAVVFLASACASFVTGACLLVDGGQSRTI